jgi:hypothetical protein
VLLIVIENFTEVKLSLEVTGVDDYIPYNSYNKVLLVVVKGFTEIKLSLEVTRVDDYIPYNSYNKVLLVVVKGFTEVELDLEAIVDEDHIPHVSDEGGLLVVANKDGVEYPQDKDGVESNSPFLPFQDEAFITAGAVCQLLQLPEPPRFFTTPSRIQLAKTNKTNELFIMIIS